MIVVYEHIRSDTNEVFYIGIAKNLNRPHDKINRNQFWKRVVSKTDYEVKIVCRCDTWSDACNIEKELIKKHGRRDLGNGTLVNLTNGGDGILGGKSWKYKTGHTKETREKMSLIQKKNSLNRVGKLGKPHTKESREKISIARKGCKISEETKIKISEKLTNRKFSEETKSRMSKSHMGKEVSNDTRLKMSNAKKGKTLSDSHKMNILNSREKLKKCVVEFDNDYNIVREYDSINHAAQKLNCNRATIRNRIKTNKGLSFKYIH